MKVIVIKIQISNRIRKLKIENLRNEVEKIKYKSDELRKKLK